MSEFLPERREGDPGPERPQSPPVALAAWVLERLQNCERIAATKTGADREGWLEDADYFRAILIRIRPSHDDRCESELIAPHGWTPCACDERAASNPAPAPEVSEGDIAAAVPSPPAQSPQRDAADLLQRLVDALDRADSNRGVFSCTDYHDLRCPLSRANSPAEWKGVWRCECGRLELDNAVAAAQAWLAEAPASREASDREAEPGAMGAGQ